MAERDLPPTVPAELEGGTTAPTGAGPLAAPDAAARGDEPEARSGWPAQLFALGLALALAGIWLMLAPFALDYSDDAAGLNSIICGGLVTFLGLARTTGVRHPVIGLAAMAIGCWLFASSFLLEGTPGADWMTRCMGAIVFFLGFTGMARSTPRPGREAATSDLRSEA